MNIVKNVEFTPSQIRYIKFDEVNYAVVSIDGSHYIGSFLSTAQASPISLDGLRYNLISPDGLTDIDPSDPLIDSKVYRIPTGVADVELGATRPRAFRFGGLVAFERPSLSIDSFDIYGDDDVQLGRVMDLELTDRLILLLNHDIDYQGFHEESQSPHRIDKNLLVQRRLSEFNTLLPDDELGPKVPSDSGMVSVFSIYPEDEKLLVDTYLEISGTQSNPIYTWRGIYRVYNSPRLFLFKDLQY